MIQKSLFDSANQSDSPKPERRQMPAQSPEYAKRVKDQILAFITEQGERGATDAEIQAASGLGIDGNTERPKRIELERERLIVDSGRTRLTDKKKPARVWVLAKYAKPFGPKPEPPAAVQKPLPIEPDKQRQTDVAAKREQLFGPILDSMSPEAVEAVCMEIFPTWPRIAGLGPHAWTPQAARKNAYTRKLLLAAIENSHREQTP